VTEPERFKFHEHIRAVHIVTILVTVLFCIAGIEAGTRFGFARLSRIERRIMTEHALTLRFGRTQSVRSILLVGDSLLLEDVELNMLAHALPADVHLQRFSIEQTTYLDWMYGLRRLFSEGVRPSTVLLCIGPNSFMSDATRGDYSAFYLFQTSDIPMVAKAAKYSLTMESSLFFSHYSLFYAGRSGLRNFILGRVDPAYGTLMHKLVTRPAPSHSRDEVLRICEPRFQELERLCSAHSAHFVYVVPPGFGFHDDAMVEAGLRASASVLVPVHYDTWGQEKFRDGFHLNEVGAGEFTQMLSPSLNALLRSFEAAR
jgi:hypothetical protein